MNNLSSMVWIELQKAIRSRMPLWTVLGSLFMPFGIAFLIFVSKNPEISQKLGIVSAKADLMKYAVTDWATYVGAYGQVIAAGGFMISIFIISWVFGREFSDGTVKDMLAVPVQRSSILLAKFILVAAWSALLAAIIFFVGLVLGMLLHLPGSATSAILGGSGGVLLTACLVILAVPPYAVFASMGRGYLLPIGVGILTLVVANLIVIIGRGEYFPWAIPMLFAQDKSSLPSVSYWIVLLTGLLGMIMTYYWWQNADQNR